MNSRTQWHPLRDTMKIQVEDISSLNGTLILPCFEGCEKPPNKTMNDTDSVTRKLIRTILGSDDFSGKSGESMSVFGGGNKVVLVGLGKKENVTSKIARDTGAKLLAKLSKKHGKNLTIRFSSEWKLNMMGAFVEGMILRDYKFDKYISKKDDDDNDDSPFNLHIQCSPRHVDNLSEICKESHNIATGVHLARDLGNTPPNDLYPMAYANMAIDWAKGKTNVSVTVIDWEGILENKMGGLENVGKGSSRKPCMVIFEMNKPSGKGNPPVIVGKGITFDTGGISLKPGASMDEMKYDMHGSATVFGLMQALHACGHSKHIVGISCMAENMPSADAYRPGDVIPTYSGKTIEVLNTDAEGRNVLADGLWKSGEFNPKFIVDLATLTGACVIALGHEASGLWSNNDELREKIRSTGAELDELAWPMPLLPAFEKEMTGSKIADVRNLGTTRWGGSNTAAAFLKQFVPKMSDEKDAEQYPWAHLDIAGTAWGASSNAMVAHGATGIHVRTLYHLIKND